MRTQAGVRPEGYHDINFLRMDFTPAFLDVKRRQVYITDS